jgi:hypothetical protein
VTSRTRGAWLARLGLVAVLSFGLSGAATVGSAADFESKACGEQHLPCDLGCPAPCTDGGCDRMLPAVLGEALGWIAAPTPECWVGGELAPPPPPLLDGVFHPPTR